MRRWRCAGGRSTGLRVDMGRNIFSPAPARDAEGGEKVVHENLNARKRISSGRKKTGRAEMNVTLVEINIKPERVDELEVFRANHEARCGSRATCALMSCRIRGENPLFIYEAYKDDEAVLAHKKTPHYLACVEKLEEMMSQPRQKRSFIGLLPQVGTSPVGEG